MTDAERVERALAGDAGAIGDLYATYGAYMRRQAVRCGAGPEADDVVQELFCRLAEGRTWHVSPAHSPADGSLHAYLTLLVRGAVRRQPWRAKYHGAYPEAFFSDVMAPLWVRRDDDPEERVLRLERSARLIGALRALPRRLRQVAQLRYVECLPGREIAARLGLHATTIPSYLAAIRERLRPVIQVVYDLPPPGHGGHLRFDREPRTSIGAIRYNAKRRLARAKARRATAAVQ